MYKNDPSDIVAYRRRYDFLRVSDARDVNHCVDGLRNFIEKIRVGDVARRCGIFESRIFQKFRITRGAQRAAYSAREILAGQALCKKPSGMTSYSSN
jgi:hypothetical protein